MWFLLALAALLMWSGSDLFSKKGSRPDDKCSHWKMVMAVGLVMGIHAAIEIFINGVEISWAIIWAYMPASLLYILSMTLGYIGLRYIELSISSPICNTSGAVAALFLLALPKLFPGLLEENPIDDWRVILAILLMAAGVLMLGIVETHEDEQIKLERQKRENVRYAKSFLALLLPVLYCVLDAAGTVADSIILEGLDESSANVAYELTFLFMGACAAVYTFGVRRQKPELPREVPKLIGAVCETAGQLAYVYAIAENAVGAAPIISCYCLLSVVWSRIFLKEKLSWKHYTAIAVAIVGIVIMGSLDP
jgi:drug/metabolite transporter (DMT)-like permease